MGEKTKFYMNFFGYKNESRIECEICSGKPAEVMEINWKDDKKGIDNLIAICEPCVARMGDGTRPEAVLSRGGLQMYHDRRMFMHKGGKTNYDFNKITIDYGTTC